MRTTTILFLFIAITLTANTQTACNNYEKMQSIPANYANTLAKFARTYWAKRCACESGNITSGTWDNSVEIMNRMYDNYQDPNFLKDYEGDPFPIPDKRMKVSDCKNGNSSQVSANASTKCDQKAFGSQEDPQNFGNQYMMARCQCLEGVSSVKQAEQLVATMKINRQSVQQYYGNGLNLPQDLKVEDCPILEARQGSNSASGSTKKDKWKIYEDNLVSKDAQNLIHRLAEESDDPELKQLSRDFNTLDKTNQQIADYNAFFNLTPSQADIEFQQVMDNLGQLAAGAKYVINKIKAAQNGPPMSPEEKKANMFMWDLRKKVKALYDEMKIIPDYYQASNTELLKKYEKKEGQYYQYDLETVVERRLLIWYFWSPERRTLEEVNAKYQFYTGSNKITLLREIDQWQNSANIGYSLYLPNADKSFELSRSLLKVKKATVLRKLGRVDEADVLMKEFEAELPMGLVIKFMRDAFENKQYEAAGYFYPAVQAYFAEETRPLDDYFFDIDKSDNDRRFHRSLFSHSASNDFSLDREEVIELLSVGVYSGIQSNNFSSYKRNIAFLKEYFNNTPSGYYNLKKQTESEILILGLEAAFEIKQQNYNEALKLIEEAEKQALILDRNSYETWIKEMKFYCYVDLNDYTKANDIYKAISRRIDRDNTTFTDQVELRYQKCVLLYNHEQYERALKGLAMLKERGFEEPKYDLLKIQIESKM